MAKEAHILRIFTLASSSIAVFALIFFLGALDLHAQESVGGVASQTPTITTPTDDAIPYSFESIPGDDIVGDFVVGPGKVELDINPGESKTIELTVTNRTGETRDYAFEVEDVAGSNDASRAVVLLGDNRGPYTLKDYIKVPSKPISIAHAQRLRIPITITIPTDAEPGGRYGSVLIKTISKGVDVTGNGASPQSTLIARIGTLFFITIPGGVQHEGSLKDFSTIPNSMWFEKGPIKFQALFENTGSIHLNPYGEIRIKNMFGEEVGFVELDPWFALPKSLRFREITWEREFLFGRYTAVMQINRGYDDIIDTKEIAFFVFPWKLALGGFFALFIIFYLLRTFFRKFEFKKRGS